jgi:acetoin utilization deacetylase AcuC-like enzyme
VTRTATDPNRSGAAGAAASAHGPVPASAPRWLGAAPARRSVAELVMVEQRAVEGTDTSSVWIREGDERLPGQDSDARLAAIRTGLRRHFGVRSVGAAASDEELERALAALHDPGHLATLAAAGAEPAVRPELAPPGLEPDIPVNAALVAAAREAARTALTAAQRLLDGDQYAYAVCRPPGHHAGPGFIGGYCYLNNAAAAVAALRDGGLAPVGVLDLDLHYPNGTSELLERMGEDATLHSLHAAPVTNVAAGTELPRAPRERAHAFAAAPDQAAYLAEVEASLEALADAAALVVSLGYDTVAGDPHGSWGFGPEAFAGIGRLLAATGLPICIVQEGGYRVDALAPCAHAFAAGLLGEDPV